LLPQVVLDLDDFYEGNTSIELLSELRTCIPNFKVNLFTIPGRCSPEFVRSMGKQDWIHLIPHGWGHYTNYEVMAWDEKTTANMLRRCEEMGFTVKGFKAPGWQISDACMVALRDAGYWLADQPYNRERRPEGLRVYELKQWVEKHCVAVAGCSAVIEERPNQYLSIHGHIGHLNGRNANALELIADSIRHYEKNPAQFRFIDELLAEDTNACA
jgi:hypothetical protein